MPKDNELKDEVAKTAAVLTGVSVLAAPLIYWCGDSKIGVAVAALITGATLYKLNEIGENNRPAPNLANRLFTPSGPNNTNLDNTFRNIVSGGEAVFDEVANHLPVTKK